MKLQARVRIWGRPRGRSGVSERLVSSPYIAHEDARVGAGAPNFELVAVGNTDQAVAHDASICSVAADHLHLVDTYLTLFRDATADLMAWERAHPTGHGRRESGDDWHIWSMPAQTFWEIHVDDKLERHSRLPGSTFRYTGVARSSAPGQEGQAIFGDGNYGPNTATGGQP